MRLLNTTTTNPLFYTSRDDLPLVSHAEGIYIWDDQGKRYIDACSGAITCNIGHNHPTVKQAMMKQLEQVAFSYRTQFESQAALDLATRLVALSEGALEKVFFVSGGSEAVESAIKLARQYFVACGQSQRRYFVSLRPSYHGSTLGALGLTGYAPLETPYAPITLASVKVPSPDFYRFTESDEDAHVDAVLAQTEKTLLEVGFENIAAIVVEPVGGASTGARMVNGRYLQGLRALCERSGCLLIMDEVLCGMGRTGAWFAYQHWGVTPDILTLAKGLGAGYYPVAAVLARADIVDAVLEGGGFMHGHTYAGNPLACATGVAVLEVMDEENLLANAREQGRYLREKLEALATQCPYIGNVRGIGLLQGVEFVQDKASKTPFAAVANVFDRITRLAKQHGLLIYPRRSLNGLRGDHVLIAPPLTVTQRDVDEIVALFAETMGAFAEVVLEQGLAEISQDVLQDADHITRTGNEKTAKEKTTKDVSKKDIAERRV
jgi:adenosylmethionine-8-amino-7-oxononanoate aminotransferase